MTRHILRWTGRALLAGAVLGLVGSFTVENAAACSKKGSQVYRQGAYRSAYRMPNGRSANWGRTGMYGPRLAYSGNYYHRHHRHHRHHHHWYGGGYGYGSAKNSQLARHHRHHHHHHHQMHRQHA